MAQILNRQRRVPIALQPLDAFSRRVARALRLDPDAFTVCLVSDAAMARMNRQFRGQRGATDVLSFPARAAGKGKRAAAEDAVGFLGDIAISPDRARRNARRLGRRLPDELRILVLHGVLHLLGYDHETDNGHMERREARLRRQLGIG